MKKKTLILSTGLALLMASAAANGQESGRLSAEYLKQATPLIHWPQGLEPTNVDVFVHNEGWIDAPPAVVWKNLVDASKWPTWYSNSADVQIEGGHDTLAQGVTFRLKALLIHSHPTARSAGQCTRPASTFTMPGSSYRRTAASALSLRKRKRA